jgi:hypothetical protein
MTPREWSWAQDLIPSRSRMLKNWPVRGVQMAWAMEVRSDNNGAGTQRLGEVFLRGSMDGSLTCLLREEEQ